MRHDDEHGERLYLAGERIPPGRYKHVDSSYILELDGEDTLPARLDGHVTYFVRIHTWSEHRRYDPATSLPPGGAR